MRRFSPCYLHIIAEMPIKCWDCTTLLSKKIPSAFFLHFLHIFFHIRMQRFLRVPVRILPSAFSPQRKCGDLGYGLLQTLKFSCIPRTIPDWISLLKSQLSPGSRASSGLSSRHVASIVQSPPQHNAPAGGPYTEYQTRQEEILQVWWIDLINLLN